MQSSHGIDCRPMLRQALISADKISHNAIWEAFLTGKIIVVRAIIFVRVLKVE